MKPIKRTSGKRTSGPGPRTRPGDDRDAPNDSAIEPFRPLGEYEWPSTSVDRGLKRFVGTVRKRLFSDDDGEVVSAGLRAIRLRTAEDNLVTVPHGTLWKENVSNASGGARTLMCIAHFHLLPEHDPDRIEAALTDVGLTSAYLDYALPVFVVLNETGYGTHYRLKAYPFDSRDQFFFVSDLTARGKAAIRRAGGTETSLAGIGRDRGPLDRGRSDGTI